MKKLTRILVAPFALALFALSSAGASAQMVTTSTSAPRLIISAVDEDGSAAEVDTAEAGDDSVMLGSFRFEAENADIMLSGLPLTFIMSGGAMASDLTACRIVEGSTTLNTGSNAMSSVMSGRNNVTFNSSLMIEEDESVILSVRCNVSEMADAGAKFQVGINTADVMAMTEGGMQVIVTFPGTVTTIPSVPSFPNTGFGGDATRTVAILGATLMVASLGLGFARKTAR